MRASLTLALTALATYALAQDPAMKRGRNEGLFFTPASNVMGNGNINLDLSADVRINQERLTSLQVLGGAIGIAEILQLRASASLLEFRRLGPIEAHLQMTTPLNDRLRFVGFALSGDIYLSTILDTLSATADKSKPEYTPYIRGSAILDFDFLSRPRQIPLKAYLTFSLCDNPALMYRYDQYSVRGGLELKGFGNALFVEAAAGYFTEKRSIQGSQGYHGYYVMIMPGGRYRIRDRFSLVGTIGVSPVVSAPQIHGFNGERFYLGLRFEAPIIYRETNTEAVRSLVFLDKKRAQQPRSIDTLTGETLLPQTTAPDGSGESFDYRKENEELIKRREEIQRRMEEIEQQLEETK